MKEVKTEPKAEAFEPGMKLNSNYKKEKNKKKSKKGKNFDKNKESGEKQEGSISQAKLKGWDLSTDERAKVYARYRAKDADSQKAALKIRGLELIQAKGGNTKNEQIKIIKQIKELKLKI